MLFWSSLCSPPLLPFGMLFYGNLCILHYSLICTCRHTVGVCSKILRVQDMITNGIGIISHPTADDSNKLRATCNMINCSCSIVTAMLNGSETTSPSLCLFLLSLSLSPLSLSLHCFTFMGTVSTSGAAYHALYCRSVHETSVARSFCSSIWGPGIEWFWFALEVLSSNFVVVVALSTARTSLCWPRSFSLDFFRGRHLVLDCLPLAASGRRSACRSWACHFCFRHCLGNEEPGVTQISLQLEGLSISITRIRLVPDVGTLGPEPLPSESGKGALLRAALPPCLLRPLVRAHHPVFLRSLQVTDLLPSTKSKLLFLHCLLPGFKLQSPSALLARLDKSELN